MSFSQTTLLKKFNELNSTQQSVQTLSLWLIHHRKHSRIIASTWLNEFLIEKNNERKLTFMYLANDILQNSRKNGSEYLDAFCNVLVDALQDLSVCSDDKTRFTIERILNIWKDRKLYTESVTEDFIRVLHKKDDKSLNSPMIEEATSRKDDNGLSPKKKLKLGDTFDLSAADLSFLGTSDAPDCLAVINMLQELQECASCDAAARQRIAAFPPQISDFNLLKNLKSKNEILEQAKIVSESADILEKYNARLDEEMLNRKKASLSLSLYKKQQLENVKKDEAALSHWRLKLAHVDSVKSELDVHEKNLPDLNLMIDTAEMLNLPSAGDLFSS